MWEIVRSIQNFQKHNKGRNKYVTLNIKNVTFCRFYSLKSRGEKFVELEVVDFGGEVTHPDGVIPFSWHETRAIVVQLKSDRLKLMENIE